MKKIQLFSIFIFIILIQGCLDKNNAPILSIPNYEIFENSELKIDLIDFQSDIDNDISGFELVLGEGNIENNIYTFISDYNSQGTYSIEIKVIDMNNNYDTCIFLITVNNINRIPEFTDQFIPKNNKEIDNTTIKFTWDAIDPDNDILYYDFYLGTDINDLQLIYTNLDVNEISISNLIRGDTYYWKVSATDNNITIESNIFNFHITEEMVGFHLYSQTNLITDPFIIIDETKYTLPITIPLTKGSSITIKIPEEQFFDIHKHIPENNVRFDFIKWEDNIIQTERTFEIIDDISISILFEEYYYLRVLPSSPQICVFEESGWYPKNTSIIITALNYERYRFYYWTLNDIDRYSYLRTITIIMDQPTNLVAYYEYVCPF